MSPTDESSPFFYNASQTLVVFLDYHSLFVKYIEGGTAASKATELKVWARSQNISIAHALVDDAKDNDPPANLKGRETTSHLLGLLRADKSAWEEPRGIKADSTDEAVFTRRPGYVSALTSDKPSDINSWLKEKGYKSLILCGLSTSGCTMRTATHATDMGYVVSVIEDACADRTEEVHKFVTQKILPTRAHVFTLDELRKAWDETS